MNWYARLIPGDVAMTSRKLVGFSTSGRLSAMMREGYGLLRVIACLLVFGMLLVSSAQAQAPTQQWMAIYSNADTQKIELDSSGNVYVAGSGYNPMTGSAYLLVIKYNSSGVQQWDATYSGLTGNGGTARDLKVDSSGNVYIMGIWYGATSADNDVVTIKYNSSGVQQWASIYNGPGNDQDDAAGLQVDSSGNVYVAGVTYGGVSTSFDYFTVKYNSL